jgi:hypothetical protein
MKLPSSLAASPVVPCRAHTGVELKAEASLRTANGRPAPDLKSRVRRTAGVELAGGGRIRDFADWMADPELVARCRDCMDEQRRLIPDLDIRFQPHPDARALVSEERLAELMASSEEVLGLETDRSISNAISFNVGHVADTMRSPEILALRRRVDELVARKVNETFTAERRLKVFCSGHFWYPPGSFMGWHTNAGAPGWRVYITHAEEPGRSFFRYRDPESGEIVTELDREWNARAFRIDPEVPLWHAIYSDTHRFAIGFIVYPHDRWLALKGRIKDLARRVLP